MVFPVPFLILIASSRVALRGCIHKQLSRLVPIPTPPPQPLPHTDTTDQDGPNGVEWLPVDQVENLLIEELGYEDQPEFEDALRGSFIDFLDNLPHVTKKQQNDK